MGEKIPPEVLEFLFLQVDNPTDLFNLRVVCKQWHAIITNERFLNMYYHKRFGPQSRRSLEWIMPSNHGLMYLPTRGYNVQYKAPKQLQGSGGVVLNNHKTCEAAFPILTHHFNNENYSMGMWLRLESYFEKVTFLMRFNDFSIELTLEPKCVRVFCSYTGGLQAQACIKVPLHRWFHIILTYSSKFQFYINGYAYSLICTEGPLTESQTSKHTILTDNNEYLLLSYEGYIKFESNARFADIQVLPFALTQYEIRAIIEQSTCIAQLNMGGYLLGHWANIYWYSKYLSNCILL